MSESSPITRGRFARHALLSLVDQAWLSALNLVLGLVLIRLATKEAYGIYAQLYVAGVFVASMTEALITNPLTTLAAGRDASIRTALIAHLGRFQSLLSNLAALLAMLGGAAVAWLADLPDPAYLAVAFGAYVKSSSMREFRRSVAFLEGQAQRVLGLDLVYGLVLAAGVGALLALDRLEVWAVLAVLTLANLLALARLPRLPRSGDEAAYRDAVARTWRRGRVGMPGAMLAWIVNYSYLYIAALWLGAAASAELNAARLLLMPISLSIVAWSRVARPLIGTCVAQGDTAKMGRVVRASVGALEAMTLAYIGVLWWVFPWLQQHVLGDKYMNAAPLVMAWGVYFILNTARWTYTSVLICQDRYRLLLLMSGISLVLMLAIIGFALPAYGAVGAILTLAIVEAASLAMIYSAYRRSFKETKPS